MWYIRMSWGGLELYAYMRIAYTIQSHPQFGMKIKSHFMEISNLNIAIIFFLLLWIRWCCSYLIMRNNEAFILLVEILKRKNSDCKDHSHYLSTLRVHLHQKWISVMINGRILSSFSLTFSCLYTFWILIKDKKF